MSTRGNRELNIIITRKIRYVCCSLNDNSGVDSSPRLLSRSTSAPRTCVVQLEGSAAIPCYRPRCYPRRPHGPSTPASLGGVPCGRCRPRWRVWPHASPSSAGNSPTPPPPAACPLEYLPFLLLGERHLYNDEVALHCVGNGPQEEPHKQLRRVAHEHRRPGPTDRRVAKHLRRGG